MRLPRSFLLVCLQPASKLHQLRLEAAAGLTRKCLETFSGTASNLPRGCFEAAANLPRCCLEPASEQLENCLQPASNNLEARQVLSIVKFQNCTFLFSHYPVFASQVLKSVESSRRAAQRFGLGVLLNIKAEKTNFL